jgi:ABC-type multidrug transport system fused ATPase/permease subunit
VPDIADIPLGQVRSTLGIIAQDPILLSGSLRLNLDLDSKYSDEQLYDALRQVQLLKRVDSDASSSASSSVTVVGEEAAQQNIFSNLDSEIKSGGEK